MNSLSGDQNNWSCRKAVPFRSPAPRARRANRSGGATAYSFALHAKEATARREGEVTGRLERARMQRSKIFQEQALESDALLCRGVSRK